MTDFEDDKPEKGADSPNNDPAQEVADIVQETMMIDTKAAEVEDEFDIKEA